jgi:hypothetical protein
MDACYRHFNHGAPHAVHTPAPTPAGNLVTERQLDYIAKLGGDLTYARKLTRGEASRYIDRLKSGAPPASRSTPVTTPPAVEPKRGDPRLDLIKGMVDLIPSGYYAVEKEEGDKTVFMRVSRPKADARTRFAGSVKIQTQHGPALENALVLWPSGNWSVYDQRAVEPMLLLVADHHGAGMRYAAKIGHCMCCNADLTDERSRWYGIGPECEKKPQYAWVIPLVDETKGAFGSRV